MRREGGDVTVFLSLVDHYLSSLPLFSPLDPTFRALAGGGSLLLIKLLSLMEKREFTLIFLLLLCAELEGGAEWFVVFFSFFFSFLFFSFLFFSFLFFSFLFFSFLFFSLCYVVCIFDFNSFFK